MSSSLSTTIQSPQQDNEQQIALTPAFRLKSAKLLCSLIPDKFREEVIFAVEGLPFYKPIIDEYADQLRNTEYEYVLSLQGDRRTKTLVSSIDGTRTSIPLVPAARFFDYFLPYLDRWGNDGEIIVDFTREQLELINKVVQFNNICYSDAKHLFEFFCANNFAYIITILDKEFIDMERLEELGEMIKDNKDNLDIDDSAVSHYFHNFKELTNALYYFAYKIHEGNTILRLIVAYCNYKAVYKDSFVYLLLLYESGEIDESGIVRAFFKAYKNEIDYVVNTKDFLYVEHYIIDISYIEMISIKSIILNQINGDNYDNDMRCVAAVVLLALNNPTMIVTERIHVSRLTGPFSKFLYNRPYNMKTEIGGMINETEMWQLSTILTIKRAFVNMMKYKEIDDMKRTIAKQIVLILEIVEVKKTKTAEIMNMISNYE